MKVVVPLNLVFGIGHGGIVPCVGGKEKRKTKISSHISDANKTRSLAVLGPTGILRIDVLIEGSNSPILQDDQDSIAITTISSAMGDLRKGIQTGIEVALAIAAGAGERDAKGSGVHGVSLWSPSYHTFHGVQAPSSEFPKRNLKQLEWNVYKIECVGGCGAGWG
jgi:hypothetical protein